MEQLNRIELVGIVGNVRFESFDGTKVARFSVVTNHAFKDHEGCLCIEATWHNVIAWEGRKNGIDNLEKGRAVHVLGRIRIQKYINVAGFESSSPEIVASEVKVIPSEEKTTPEIAR